MKRDGFTKSNHISRNCRLAKSRWPNEIGRLQLERLKILLRQYSISVASGDVLLLSGDWYITHAGLLGIALRRRCHGIITSIQHRQSDLNGNRWIFKATVYKREDSKGFVGYGDADPSNVSPLVRGAEMRVAETRAVNRALRKAYGIGLCSIEELGWTPRSTDSSTETKPTKNGSGNGNGNGNGNGTHVNYQQPRLRDRLCLLIRQHRLDPNLVKSYAADFCGTPALRDASRERLEEFVNRLSEQATTDRDALICQLNNFAPASEVHP